MRLRILIMLLGGTLTRTGGAAAAAMAKVAARARVPRAVPLRALAFAGSTGAAAAASWRLTGHRLPGANFWGQFVRPRLQTLQPSWGLQRWRPRELPLC